MLINTIINAFSMCFNMKAKFNHLLTGFINLQSSPFFFIRIGSCWQLNYPIIFLSRYLSCFAFILEIIVISCSITSCFDSGNPYFGSILSLIPFLEKTRRIFQINYLILLKNVGNFNFNCLLNLSAFPYAFFQTIFE
jgi:hypothetical protein